MASKTNSATIADATKLENEKDVLSLDWVWKGLIMFLINTALLYVLKKLAAKLKSTECYRNFSIKTVFKIITDFLKWLWNLFLFVLEPYGAFTTLITVNFAFFSSSFLIFIFYVGIFNLELNDDLRILTSLKYALYTCCSNIVIIMVCQCLSGFG